MAPKENAKGPQEGKKKKKEEKEGKKETKKEKGDKGKGKKEKGKKKKESIGTENADQAVTEAGGAEGGAVGGDDVSPENKAMGAEGGSENGIKAERKAKKKEKDEKDLKQQGDGNSSQEANKGKKSSKEGTEDSLTDSPYAAPMIHHRRSSLTPKKGKSARSPRSPEAETSKEEKDPTERENEGSKQKKEKVEEKEKKRVEQNKEKRTEEELEKNKDEQKEEGEKEDENQDEKKKKKKKKEVTSILNDEQLDELNEMPGIMAELNVISEQYSAEVREFSDIVDTVSHAVDDLLERHTGYDIQLLWRIDGFYRKFKEAENKIKPIIFSPSFETHPHGYRLALSLCPYGDGKFRGQYMSLFFCILRGENDALLAWPFALPISFTLISQADDLEERVDHISTFIPNPVIENKAFLGRPKGSRNPSLGLPKFIRIEEVWEDQFVKDDQMFLKVKVDASEVTYL